MTRYPGRDEQGRPIVAELGRAETPAETAARKAENSRNYRGSQTLYALIGAILASLAIMVFLVLVVVRPDAQPLYQPVDVAAAAESAQPGAAEPLVVPVLPEGWYANRAGFDGAPADGVARWEVGIITTSRGYLALTQGIDANPSWLAGQLRETAAGPVLTLGGLEWTSYDRRDVDDPGNLAYALVHETGASTVIIGGDASEADFAALAEAVAEALGR